MVADRRRSGPNRRAAARTVKALAGELEAGDAGLVALVLTAADSLDREVARVAASGEAKAYVVPAMERAYLGALAALDDRLERRREFDVGPTLAELLAGVVDEQ